MNSIKTLLLAMRWPFLLLTPLCVGLGCATAFNSQGQVDLIEIGWVMTGALAAHIAVNMLNEYHDFKSGLDFNTQPTPFSGGSGALPRQPQMASMVWIIGIVALLVSVAIGLYLSIQHGAELLPLGVVGTLLILTYTRWINRMPWLCLVAPGTGFGLLMVIGTHRVLTGELSGFSMYVSMVPFFLVNNLLLINQYPDIEADAAAGRRHLLIVYGAKWGAAVYVAFTMAVIAVLLVGVWLQLLPLTSLLALVPMVLCFYVAWGVWRFADELGQHPRYLAVNTLITFITIITLGVTLMIG